MKSLNSSTCRTRRSFAPHSANKVTCEVCTNKPDKKMKGWQQLLVSCAWITFTPLMAVMYMTGRRTEHPICSFHLALVVLEYWCLGLCLGWAFL